MIEVWKCEVLKFLLAGFKLYASNENNSSVAPVTYHSMTQNTVFRDKRKLSEYSTNTFFKQQLLGKTR